MHIEFQVEEGDFTRAGYASSQIKKNLKSIGIPAAIIKRVVIAVYEAEVNIVAHAYRGEILVDIDAEGVTVLLKDEGPGIPDINKAMQKGFSTASHEVRQMGFGAGMGLPNILENSDDFKIDSQVGVGTTITIFNRFS
ncbi:MAG: ATP-binding protein [bacterium]